MTGRGIPFSRFMESALYDPESGFYARHGSAGRRGDFLTAPEVGPLFGALVAERLDREWDRLGRPDPFAVVEVGAGPGTLARTVAVAAPRCAAALRYLLVEISTAQRARHADHLPGWIGDMGADVAAVESFVASEGSGASFASASIGPSGVRGVVLANELLDNLPFDIVRTTETGAESLTVVEEGDIRSFVAERIGLPHEMAAIAATVPVGTWFPWQRRARDWVRHTVDGLVAGVVVVLDYGATTAELAERGPFAWLRTYVGHERGTDPLVAPGRHDITADVAVDQLALDLPPTLCTTQREWLVGLGIEGLVAEGRRIWQERAGAPDVLALRARSRVGESEALLDPAGLGGFLVLEWSR